MTMVPLLLLLTLPYNLCTSSVSSDTEEVFRLHRVANSHLGSAGIMAGDLTPDTPLPMQIDIDEDLRCAMPVIKTAFLDACGNQHRAQVVANKHRKRFIPFVIGGVIAFALASGTIGTAVYFSNENDKMKDLLEVLHNQTREMERNMTAYKIEQECIRVGNEVRSEYARRFPDQNGLTHFDGLPSFNITGAYEIQLSNCEVTDSSLRATVTAYRPQFEFVGELYETTHLGQMVRNKSKLLGTTEHQHVIINDKGETRTVKDCKPKKGPLNGYYKYECKLAPNPCDPVTMAGCNITERDVTPGFTEIERIGKSIIIRTTLNKYSMTFLHSSTKSRAYPIDNGVALITCHASALITVGNQSAQCIGDEYIHYQFWPELTEYEKRIMADIEERERIIAEEEKSWNKKMSRLGEGIVASIKNTIAEIFENPLHIAIAVAVMALALLICGVFCYFFPWSRFFTALLDSIKFLTVTPISWICTKIFDQLKQARLLYKARKASTKVYVDPDLEAALPDEIAQSPIPSEVEIV